MAKKDSITGFWVLLVACCAVLLFCGITALAGIVSMVDHGVEIPEIIVMMVLLAIGAGAAIGMIRSRAKIKAFRNEKSD